MRGRGEGGGGGEGEGAASKCVPMLYSARRMLRLRASGVLVRTNPRWFHNEKLGAASPLRTDIWLGWMFLPLSPWPSSLPDYPLQSKSTKPTPGLGNEPQPQCT